MLLKRIVVYIMALSAMTMIQLVFTPIDISISLLECKSCDYPVYFLGELVSQSYFGAQIALVTCLSIGLLAPFLVADWIVPRRRKSNI